MGFRAVCLTDNAALRRTLRRSLQGAGGAVEFVSVSACHEVLAGAVAGADLVLLDPEARATVDIALLGRTTGAQVIVLGGSLDSEGVLALLREERLNHVIGDVSEGGHEEALVITSGKVWNGDLFGLEKYLARGALVREQPVGGYDDKRRAVDAIAAFALDVGARRTLVGRIEAVTDELLMNALYDAPATRHGLPFAEARARPPEAPVLLRYASDGRALALSVRDAFGELRKEAILDHLERARAQRGAPDADLRGGAGLGLWLVVTSVTRFVANIDPGQITEVIALFDLRVSGRERGGCARSLHIFTTVRPG